MDTVLRIAADELITLDVLQIVHQNVLAEHVDEGLNVSCHFILVIRLFQLTEVVVWEGHLEELDIKLVPEEHSGVFDVFVLAHVVPYLIAQVHNSRDNLLLGKIFIALLGFALLVELLGARRRLLLTAHFI